MNRKLSTDVIEQKFAWLNIAFDESKARQPNDGTLLTLSSFEANADKWMGMVEKNCMKWNSDPASMVYQSNDSAQKPDVPTDMDMTADKKAENYDNIDIGDFEKWVTELKISKQELLDDTPTPMVLCDVDSPIKFPGTPGLSCEADNLNHTIRDLSDVIHELEELENTETSLLPPRQVTLKSDFGECIDLMPKLMWDGGLCIGNNKHHPRCMDTDNVCFDLMPKFKNGDGLAIGKNKHDPYAHILSPVDENTRNSTQLLASGDDKNISGRLAIYNQRGFNRRVFGADFSDDSENIENVD